MVNTTCLAIFSFYGMLHSAMVLTIGLAMIWLFPGMLPSAMVLTTGLDDLVVSWYVTRYIGSRNLSPRNDLVFSRYFARYRQVHVKLKRVTVSFPASANVYFPISLASQFALSGFRYC